MSKKIRTEAVDSLFEAVLSLKNKEECYIFFEDICTINELLSLSQRFEVAKMLREQKTYLEIAEKTGASTATISRVNRIWSLRGSTRKIRTKRSTKTEAEIKTAGDREMMQCTRDPGCKFILFYLLMQAHQ